MKTETKVFKNPASESIKRAVEEINKRQLKMKHNNVVDPIEFTKEYFNKGKELDEQININNSLINESITYETTDKEVIKYQVIRYNDEVIRKQLIYKRLK